MKQFTSYLFLFIIHFSAKSQSDLWLLPTRFFPTNTEEIEINIFSGNNLEGSKTKFSLDSFDNFKHFGNKARKINDSNIKVVFEENGIHSIIMDRKVNINQFNYNSFVSYLEENLLDEIKEKSVVKVSTNDVITENRIDYLKMLVQVGSFSDNTYRTPTNQRLEIIPLTNPFGTNTSVSFQIMLDNQTLDGYTVQHITKNSTGKTEISGIHTDKNGIANFTISRGIHLIKVIYMSENQDKSIAEFETLVASLTFGKK